MKYALVTGASRGIGRAISLKLAEMGYYILINYNSNHQEAENTLNAVREKGSDGELMPFDVRNATTVKEALDRWHAEHKSEYIEVLINNAGIRKDNLMIWMPEGDWNSVMDTNLNSFFHVTQPLLKNMLHKRYGRIINIVSLSGIKGMKGQVNYSAAKGGVIAATKALAAETGPRNVTVNAVAPGFINTDMIEEIDEAQLKHLIPAGRFGTAEEVAAAVGFLASKEASYITGEVISVNGGLYT
ncbi:MAG: 3-oxoacyl-ACP reductase FabG [Dysgonomonas sp.]|nr:3-oxoacyl-ACP reductase FabG [Dysgonomonas sp.]